MKNNPSQPNPDEIPGELLLEITRNVFAAAALTGLIASHRFPVATIADEAFDQADRMMTRSKLPQLIAKLQNK